MSTTFTWNITDAPNDKLYGPSIFANNTFTILGQGDGTVATSADGEHWTITSDRTTVAWDQVVFGGGIYVAIDSSVTNISYSPDGLNWTPIAIGEAFNNAKIAYGNGVFVITTYRTGTPVQPITVTSNNGIDWTINEGIFAGGTYFRGGLAFGNGKFVANLVSSVNKSATSTNGVIWNISSSTSPYPINWLRMAAGNGLFITIGANRRLMISSDGETWTAQTTPAISNQNFNSISFCNGIFVINGFALVITAYNPFALFSTDGINWTMNSPSTDTGILYSTYGDNKIICTGPNGTARIIYGLWSEIIELIIGGTPGLSSPSKFTIDGNNGTLITTINHTFAQSSNSISNTYNDENRSLANPESSSSRDSSTCGGNKNEGGNDVKINEKTIPSVGSRFMR